MKQLEDMTLKEIKELEEQYRKEFAECLGTFFKERPLIKYIHLYRHSGFGIQHDSSILVYANEPTLGSVSSVKLKNINI